MAREIAEFDGEQLSRLLRRMEGEAIADALIGCRFYKIDPERTFAIVACDPASGLLSIEGEHRREARAALSAGYVLCDDDRLQIAVSSVETDEDRAERQTISRVVAAGLPASAEIADRELVCRIIDQTSVGELPSNRDRKLVSGVFEKYGSHRALLKLLRQWRDLCGSAVVPGDLVIQMTSTLRTVGYLREAIAQTNILLRRDHSLSPAQAQILFNQRAALWLDLYEVENDPKLLARARRAAGQSWAIGPSDHCSNVYEKLKRLETTSRDEVRHLEQSKRREGVDNAWAAWKLGQDPTRR